MSAPALKHRAVIYARLSVSNEESVSIERQIESCRRYADSQEWEVIAVHQDDGVSASYNKPEQRVGWRAVLNESQRFDVVIVWKVDRLARKVLDFLHADEALAERQAAIVSATEPIDMSTDTGRAFATMLSVFAQLEASAISARVKGARDFLIRHGRLAGGTVPYGYKAIPNPDGKGFVLAQDPDRIGYVIEAATRALDKKSIYSIKQYLSENAPLPTTSQKNRKTREWQYSTVERMLRNPILAGMTAYNPGNKSKERGDEVLRDETGLPVIDESLAILSTEQRRDLLGKLDDKSNPQRRPRASRNITPSLLSNLAQCGDCAVTMHRGTTTGRPALYCPKCFQTISMTQLLPHVERRLMNERGDEYGIEEVAEHVDNAADLADIAEAMNVVTSKMQRDGADVPALVSQLEGLKQLRAKAQITPTSRHVLSARKTQTVREEWEAATDDLEKRAVLANQVATLSIHRGKVGRKLDPTRVHIVWAPRNAYGDALDEAFSQMKPGDTFTEAVQPVQTAVETQ